MAKDGAAFLKHPISLSPERAAKTTELHLPRIMAVEGYYACGICHRCHATLSQAGTCLKACLAKEPPRIPMRVRGERQYCLCPICAKGYAAEQDALLCLERCLESTEGIHSAIKEFGLRILAQARSPERFRGPGHGHRPLRVFVNQPPAAPPPREELAVSLPPAPAPASLQAMDHGFDEEHAPPPAAPPPPPAATPAPTPMEATIVENRTDGPYRKEGQQPFTRADARYECTCCHQLYFTKMEVENCFTSHPIDPDPIV